MKKRYLLFAVLSFSLMSCNSSSTSSDETSESLSSSDSIPSSYEIKFYDNEELISSQEVVSIDQINYPNLENTIINNQNYEFVGWDLNGDNIADTIDELNDNITFYSVYKLLDYVNVSYTYNGSVETLKVDIGGEFTLPIPDSIENAHFFYYEDEDGNAYTDMSGKSLEYVYIDSNITLTPKYLYDNVENQKLSLFSYPQSKLSGSRLEQLKMAIENEEVTYLDDDTITYNNIRYEVVSAISNGNIFHDYSRVVNGETYYFEYEPVEFDVISFSYSSENGRYTFDISTSNIIGSLSSNCEQRRDSWGTSAIFFVKPGQNEILIDIMNGFEVELITRGTNSIRIPSACVTKTENIKELEKEASDYVLASTTLPICYEEGYMFRTNFLTGNLENEIRGSDTGYFYDCYGNRHLGPLNGYYGQLEQYYIVIKGEVL